MLFFIRMETIYTKRLEAILISPHRDELIKGLMKDLRMYCNQHNLILHILKSDILDDKCKVNMLKMFLELG